MLDQISKTGCARPACLPTLGHVKDGKWCHIAGWGKTDNHRLKDALQEAGLNSMSQRYCMDHSHHREVNFHFRRVNVADRYVFVTRSLKTVIYSDSFETDLDLVSHKFLKFGAFLIIYIFR